VYYLVPSSLLEKYIILFCSYITFKLHIYHCQLISLFLTMTIPSSSSATVEARISISKALAIKTQVTNSTADHQDIDIIDIRHDAVEVSLKDEILSLLKPSIGLKQLPTMLLYSERGLQLFEEVSTK